MGTSVRQKVPALEALLRDRDLPLPVLVAFVESGGESTSTGGLRGYA